MPAAARERLRFVLGDPRRARRRGPAATARRQQTRLADLVAHARAHSPYYRDLYADVPDRVEDPTLLPATSKAALMARFDDWVTDPQITLDRVQAFITDPPRIGTPFLSRYLVATTSGVTGSRGIFVQDDRMHAALTATTARAARAWISPADAWRLLRGGMRTVMLCATDGHFAGVASVARQRASSRSRAKRIQALSVHLPMPELVARLNRFRPAMLTGYASAISLLAGEQQAGRLRIHPALVVPSGEGLADEEYARIGRVFGAKVRNQYSCTEFMGLAYGCAQHWLHVNSDWVVLEPVDADHRPTPAGQLSHTVLLSNLANRVQPVLRYDLGDSVLQRPDPCPCGDPLPAIRVQGRAADVLVVPTGRGAPVRLPPLALGTVVDRIPGVALFQIVQDAPTRLRVRLQPAPGADGEQVWSAVHQALTALLAAHQLDHVTVQHAAEPPSRGAGGKVRTVIPLPANRTSL